MQGKPDEPSLSRASRGTAPLCADSNAFSGAPGSGEEKKMIGERLGKAWDSAERYTPIPILKQAAVLLALIAILFYKFPSAFLSPALFAEDGPIFFFQAYKESAASLIHPYAGYLHLVTRIFAWICSWLPLETIPSAYVWCSVLAVWLVALYIMGLRWISESQRILFSFALVLVPHGGENFLTLTNAHWILSVPLLFLLFEPAFQTWGRFAFCAFWISALGLNDPHLCIFFPFFVLRLLFARLRPGTAGSPSSFSRLPTAKEWFYFLVVCCCVFIQGGLLLANAVCSAPSKAALSAGRGWGLVNWLGMIFIQPAVCFFAGGLVPRLCYYHHGLLAVVGLLFLAVIGTILYAFVRADTRTRWTFSILIGIGFFVLLSSLARLFTCPQCFTPFGADRYFYIPYLCWCFALLVLTTNADHQIRRIGCLVLAVALLGSTSTFVIPAKKDWKWKERIDETVGETEWETAIREFRQNGYAKITFLPFRERFILELKKDGP